MNLASGNDVRLCVAYLKVFQVGHIWISVYMDTDELH